MLYVTIHFHNNNNRGNIVIFRQNEQKYIRTICTNQAAYFLLNLSKQFHFRLLASMLQLVQDTPTPWKENKPWNENKQKRIYLIFGAN
jgi:hypothetical protein